MASCLVWGGRHPLPPPRGQGCQEPLRIRPSTSKASLKFLRTLGMRARIQGCGPACRPPPPATRQCLFAVSELGKLSRVRGSRHRKGLEPQLQRRRRVAAVTAPLPHNQAKRRPLRGREGNPRLACCSPRLRGPMRGRTPPLPTARPPAAPGTPAPGSPHSPAAQRVRPRVPHTASRVPAGGRAPRPGLAGS